MQYSAKFTIKDVREVTARADGDILPISPFSNKGERVSTYRSSKDFYIKITIKELRNTYFDWPTKEHKIHYSIRNATDGELIAFGYEVDQGNALDNYNRIIDKFRRDFIIKEQPLVYKAEALHN